MLREVLSTELYTILLVFCLFLVTATKLIFPKRFYHFIRLVINFKYLKVYIRVHKFFNLFELLLFLNLLINLSIFLLLVVKLDVYLPKSEYNLPLQLALSIAALLIFKYILELLISKILKLDYLVVKYVFHKSSYKNFIGVLLLPINVVLLYAWHPTLLNRNLFIIFLLLIHTFGIILFVKDNLKLLKTNWFYFILYLCTLEILPYYILYNFYKML